MPSVAQAVKARPAESLPALLDSFQAQAQLAAQPAHARRMVSIIRRFLLRQEVTEAAEIGNPAVADYLAALAASGRGPKTLLNHKAALSRFCRFLVDRGLLARDPSEWIRLRRPEELLPRWLDDAEVKLVLRIARAQGIWPEVCLALSTGLRLSELIRLQWADVDFRRRCLSVRKSKSGRPRVVPLSSSAVAALQEQRKAAGRFAYVFPARQTCRAWCRFTDKPRAINWWGRALGPIKEAVPKFSSLPGRSTGRGWHLFRHTFASRAAQAGVSLYKLAEWLGHSDVRMTKIYAHLQTGFDPEIEKAAAPLEPEAEQEPEGGHQ